jgi:ribonuclease HII
MTVIVPTLRHERRLWNEGVARVAGVDEVGVAPTCGAVVAAAVIMKPGCHRIEGVRDSKTLSPAQRERLAPMIRKRAVAVGVGAASVREIDSFIYHATHLAMRRAIACPRPRPRHRRRQPIVGFEGHRPYTNVVDGDARSTRSPVRRSSRRSSDRMMSLLAARYPGYGWKPAGYATRDHRDAIRAWASTPFHRRSSSPWRTSPATSSTSTAGRPVGVAGLRGGSSGRWSRWSTTRADFGDLALEIGAGA